MIQKIERYKDSVKLHHLSEDYWTFAGATDGVVVVFAAAGVMTDADVGVVIIAVVVAPLDFAAVVVAAEIGFVALAVVVAAAALASFCRKEEILNVILPQNTLHQSLFKGVYLVKDYVTIIVATGDVAVVDVAIGAGTGVVLAAVVVVLGAFGLASVAVAD